MIMTGVLKKGLRTGTTRLEFSCLVSNTENTVAGFTGMWFSVQMPRLGPKDSF